MKKKFLVILLALAIISSMATLLVACVDDEHTHTYATEWTADDTYHWKAATCEHTAEVSEKAEHSYGSDGKCTVCQKGKNVVASITQEEWAAFFDSLTTISFEAEINIPAMEGEHYVKQYNGVTYWEQTVYGDTEKVYTSYDDATYTVITYWKNSANWKKETRVYNDSDEYGAFKVAHTGLAETAFGLDYASQQSGAGVGLDELYSAFTYDSDSDAYVANLYYMEVGYDQETKENVYYYNESVWTLKFEDGKIVSGSLTQTVSEQSMTMNFTIGYNVTELIIPSDVLSAPENS